MLDHKKNILLAVELSKISVANGSSPFGCIIVEEATGKIVGQGYNRVVLDKDPTAHGEITAIRQACKALDTFDLSNCVLYTSCEPCPMCLNTCKWANISKVYYAADRNDAERIGFRDKLFYESDPLTLEQISSAVNEARNIMKEWYQKKNKVLY